MDSVHLCASDIILTCQSVADVCCSYRDCANQECRTCHDCQFRDNGICSGAHYLQYDMCLQRAVSTDI